MTGAWSAMLRCPSCGGSLEERSPGRGCPACGNEYAENEGLPDLMPPGTGGLALEEREHYTEKLDYYVGMHEAWRESPFYRHYHHRFLDDIRSLPAGSPVLELGCGLGHDGLELLRSGYRLVETDISPGQIGHARRMQHGEGFAERSFHLLADATRLPFADGSFDGVLMVAMLHHLRDPLKALREVHRVLRNGGLLVLGTEPNTWQHTALFPLGKRLLGFAFRLAGRKGDPGETVSAADKETDGFSRYELEWLLMRAGFDSWELEPAGLFSAAAFFVGQHLSELTGRSIRLFPLEKAGLTVDRALQSAGRLKRYPWHWNAVAGKGRASPPRGGQTTRAPRCPAAI